MNTNIKILINPKNRSKKAIKLTNTSDSLSLTFDNLLFNIHSSYVNFAIMSLYNNVNLQVSTLETSIIVSFNGVKLQKIIDDEVMIPEKSGKEVLNFILKAKRKLINESGIKEEFIKHICITMKYDYDFIAYAKIKFNVCNIPVEDFLNHVDILWEKYTDDWDNT